MSPFQGPWGMVKGAPLWKAVPPPLMSNSTHTPGKLELFPGCAVGPSSILDTSKLFLLGVQIASSGSVSQPAFVGSCPGSTNEPKVHGGTSVFSSLK